MQHSVGSAATHFSRVGFQPIFERLFYFIKRLLYLSLWALWPSGKVGGALEMQEKNDFSCHFTRLALSLWVEET